MCCLCVVYVAFVVSVLFQILERTSKGGYMVAATTFL